MKVAVLNQGIINRPRMFKDIRTDEEITFYDTCTGMYFVSTLYDILRAHYEFNRNMAIRGYVSLEELYNFYGVEFPEEFKDYGWNSWMDAEFYGFTFIDVDVKVTDIEDGMEIVVLRFPVPPYLNYLD